VALTWKNYRGRTRLVVVIRFCEPLRMFARYVAQRRGGGTLRINRNRCERRKIRCNDEENAHSRPLAKPPRSSPRLYRLASAKQSGSPFCCSGSVDFQPQLVFFVNGHIASNPNERFNFSSPFKKRKISGVGGHVDDNHRKTAACGSRSGNDCLDCMDCFLGICNVSGFCMVAVSAAEAVVSARGGARR
jgi:hypothetical protein